MRIVYVLTSLGVGGAEKQALAVAERMQERGHTVAVLALQPHLAVEWPTHLQKTYLGMNKNPLRATEGILQARHFLRQFKPDLVHSHSYHSNIVARLLARTVPGLHVISTIHNVYEGGRLRMLGYRLTDGLSQRTVAVSQAAAQTFVRLRAVPAAKMGAIANGIDVGAFVPNRRRREDMRATAGIAADERGGETFIWLAVGRVAPAKDYPNLLRAFAGVHGQHAGAELWIAGDWETGSFSGCRDLAAALGIDDAVRWLGGRRDVAAILDAADGFVSSSAWEGMPLAVAEAMAMEKPVVATDVGGVRELVGEAGIVVQARNAAVLAEAMLGVMRQSGEARRLSGHAARKRIVEHFSIETSAAAWESLYCDLAV